MEHGTTTPHLNLKKPAGNDYYLINDANDNMDIIDAYAASVNATLATLALKSTITDATVPASAWTGTAAPFKAQITVPGINPANGHYLIADASLTVEQRTAFIAASVSLDYAPPHTAGVATNTIFLIAFFEKPTIDLPIKIEMR